MKINAVKRIKMNKIYLKCEMWKIYIEMMTKFK